MDIEWQHLFDEGALRRGRLYAAQGRVYDLEPLDDSGANWRARVRGSGSNRYQVELRFALPVDPADPVLESDCSCPLGGECKHAVAVLAAALGDTPPPGADDIAPPARTAASAADRPPRRASGSGDAELPREWEHWLQRLQGAQSAAAGGAPVGLLLHAASRQELPEMRVGIVAFSPGKRGGLVSPRSVGEPGTPGALQPEGGWRPQDLVALQLLLRNVVERSGQIAYSGLRGAGFEQAFEQLAQQLPVYLERAAVPLTPGPARSMQLQWIDQPDGSQRLGCRFDDDTPLRLLRAHSLWYVDEQRACFGRIDGDARWLALLEGAPLLAPDQVAPLRQRLQQRGADAALPLPVLREPRRRKPVAPRGVLQLDVFRPERGHREPLDPEPVGLARLRFDYGDLRIEPDEPERVTRLLGGELVEQQRDVAAEHALERRLRALELVDYMQLPWPQSYAFTRAGYDALLLAPGRNRQPLPADQWHAVLRILQAEGWQFDYAPAFPRPLREVEVGEIDAELDDEGNAWFGLALGIEIDGQRMDLLPILRSLIADPSFPLQPRRGEKADATWRVALDDERAVRLPLARLRALLAPLLEWLLRAETPRLHRSQGELLASLGANVRWRGDARLRERLVDLRLRPDKAVAPKGFRAKLRPYQRAGLAWLEFLAEAGLGGVLADDMGLGKTVQVLAHLLAQRQRRDAFRTLVVAPTSLMGNWRDEAERFAPALRVLVLHGPERGARYDEIASHDLVLTTYPLLSRDRERLLEHSFDLLVLDEAQAIKNARSQAAQVVREIRATRRLAMTGTPLENHLGELWAQFDAVEPGLLGSEADFGRFYRTPIEKHGDRERQQRLHRRIGALLLRRRKDEVLKDLPPKTEMVRLLDLDGAQRELYETLRLAQHQRVREAVAERGLAQSGIVVIDALLKLRQACCDPRLVKLPAARKVHESAKLDTLQELLDTLLDEGRRVLLFSQFTAMLDLIEERLRDAGRSFVRLDGDTPSTTRAAVVRRFQRGEAPLFLISLKAGGVGLNLTAADTVIHYDPWWNPASENQATDRAHRIGQNKPVFVYKLICAGTVEEKILAMQSRKAALAQAVLEGGRSTALRFDEADLAELFAPLR